MTTNTRRGLSALSIPLLLALPLASCSGGGEAGAGDAGAGASSATEGEAKAATVAIESGTHEVRCGCKIESIGHCGNYVAVEGDWVEIANPDAFGLGKMEWCGVPAEDHVMATVAGTRTGDSIELTELEVQ